MATCQTASPAYHAVLSGRARLLQEVKLLERIELACEEQLAATFENYGSLSEDSPSGLAENGAPTPEQPAPALRPAVGLCSELHQPVYTECRRMHALGNKSLEILVLANGVAVPTSHAWALHVVDLPFLSC